MFLGLAEEVSNSEDELDEEDKAALAHAYAQIEEVQRMNRGSEEIGAHLATCASSFEAMDR